MRCAVPRPGRSVERAEQEGRHHLDSRPAVERRVESNGASHLHDLAPLDEGRPPPPLRSSRPGEARRIHRSVGGAHDCFACDVLINGTKWTVSQSSFRGPRRRVSVPSVVVGTSASIRSSPRKAPKRPFGRHGKRRRKGPLRTAWPHLSHTRWTATQPGAQSLVVNVGTKYGGQSLVVNVGTKYGDQSLRDWRGVELPIVRRTPTVVE